MKKLLLIAAIVIAAGWLMIRQHAQLNELRTKEAALRQRAEPAKRPVSPRGGNATPSITYKLTLTESVSADLRGLLLGIHHAGSSGVSGDDGGEKRQRFLEACSKLNHLDAAMLLADFTNDPSIPGELRESADEIVFSIMEHSNPREAFLFVFNDPGYPKRDYRLGSAFRLWALQHPKEAARWHEQHAAGLAEIKISTAFVDSLASAFANTDADRALAYSLDPHAASSAVKLSAIGGMLAQSVGSASAHQAFLLALDRAEASAGDPQTVRDLRTGYVERTVTDLYQWPYEEAVYLIDGCLRDDERQLAFNEIVLRGDLADWKKWADRFSKVEETAATGHPLVRIIRNWTHSDPDAAGRWLERATPGELRDRAILEHAYGLKSNDPASAAAWTLKLPASAARGKIQSEILKTWKPSDAAAASRFADQHGITMP